MSPALGLNRWDWRTPAAFAACVAAAEQEGVEYAFLPVNPLAIPDPYVLIAAGAAATATIRFGPLLETPVLRPPAVAAGSIATVAQLAAGRLLFTYGVGDTAVRWLGQRPARLAELEASTVELRRLLAGERIDVGATAPAWLRHAVPVPVWVAASGPRSLRAAGRSADGVFMRVGIHPANVQTAVEAVRAGAADAGRDPNTIRLGLIVHTVTSDDPDEIRAVTRAMAAGFYEYAPALFDPPGFVWEGTPIADLRREIWPDFHHAADLVAAGALLDFLPDDVADAFAFRGTAQDVADQLRSVLAVVPEIEIVVPHPVPMPSGPALGAYARWLGQELRPLI